MSTLEFYVLGSIDIIFWLDHAENERNGIEQVSYTLLFYYFISGPLLKSCPWFPLLKNTNAQTRKYVQFMVHRPTN